jgi:hypothetical protein
MKRKRLIVGIVAASFCWMPAKAFYRDEFDGAAGDARRKQAGKDQISSKCETDGRGWLIAGSSQVSNYRVDIGSDMKALGDKLSALRITVVFKSPKVHWIGFGFTGDRAALILNPESKGGPWLQCGSDFIFLRGGSGSSGSAQEFRGCYSPGTVVTNEIIYYPARQAVDLYINGQELARGVRILHQDPAGKESRPVLEWFQMIFFKQDQDGGAFDSFHIEEICDPGAAGMVG